MLSPNSPKLPFQITIPSNLRSPNKLTHSLGLIGKLNAINLNRNRKELGTPPLRTPEETPVMEKKVPEMVPRLGNQSATALKKSDRASPRRVGFRDDVKQTAAPVLVKQPGLPTLLAKEGSPKQSLVFGSKDKTSNNGSTKDQGANVPMQKLVEQLAKNDNLKTVNKVQQTQVDTPTEPGTRSLSIGPRGIAGPNYIDIVKQLTDEKRQLVGELEKARKGEGSSKREFENERLRALESQVVEQALQLEVKKQNETKSILERQALLDRKRDLELRLEGVKIDVNAQKQRMQAEIASLQLARDTLQRTLNEKVQKELAAAQRGCLKCAELQSKIQIQFFAEGIDSAVRAAQDHATERTALESQCKALNKDLANMRQSQESKDKEMVRGSAQLAQINKEQQADITKLKQQLEQVQATLNQSQTEKQRLDDQVKVLQAQSSQERGAYEDKIDSLVGAMANLDDENRKLQEQRTSLEKAKSNLLDENHKLQEQNATSTEALNKQIRTLQLQIRNMADEHAAQTKSLSDQILALSEHHELAVSASEVQRKDEVLRARNHLEEYHASSLEEQQRIIVELESYIKEGDTQFAQLSREKQELSDELGMLRGQNTDYLKKIEKNEDELTTLRGRVEELEEYCHEGEVQFVLLKQQIASIGPVVPFDQRPLILAKQEIEDLKRQIAELEEYCHEGEVQHIQLKQQLAIANAPRIEDVKPIGPNVEDLEELRRQIAELEEYCHEGEVQYLRLQLRVTQPKQVQQETQPIQPFIDQIDQLKATIEELQDYIYEGELQYIKLKQAQLKQPTPPSTVADTTEEDSAPLKQRLEELEQYCQEGEEQYLLLRAEKKRLQDAIAQQHSPDRSDEVDRLVVENARLRAQVDDLLEYCEAGEQQMVLARLERQQLQGTIQQLKSQPNSDVPNKTNEVADLRAQIDELEYYTAEGEEQYLRLKQDLSKPQQAGPQTTLPPQALDTEELREQVSELEDYILAAEEQYIRLKQLHLKDQAQQVVVVQLPSNDNNQELFSTISDLQEYVANGEDAFVRLKQQHAQSEASLRVAQTQLKAMSVNGPQVINALAGNTIKIYEDENNDLKAKIEELESYISDAESQYVRMLQEMGLSRRSGK